MGSHFLVVEMDMTECFSHVGSKGREVCDISMQTVCPGTSRTYCLEVIVVPRGNGNDTCNSAFFRMMYPACCKAVTLK